ncbi:MAG: RIP metalloprotease RseP [Limnochordia bacterium]|jgi:regulator of sigma E protease|nr:RIP metalloprotease RseP [Limnochordia bacterium]MDD2628943.1 RIP metalloprotease RseP [Limnochordia bacterium]MDD4516925.1 RIP metalloprotease RseP [Limnochordia bacterium]
MNLSAIHSIFGNVVLTAVAFVVVFGLLVFFHEFGHFILAKLNGVMVYEFALGFGPKLWSRKRKETLYALRAIPLGGFVRIAGMDEELGEDGETPVPIAPGRSFEDKGYLQKLSIIAAGPLMNFVLTVLIMVALVSSVSEWPPLVTYVEPGYPAYEAGLKEGDRIVSIDGKKITEEGQVGQFIAQKGEQPLIFRVEREDRFIELEVVPRSFEGQMKIGIHYAERLRTDFLHAISSGFKVTWELIRLTIWGIGQMITGRMEADVAGPVGIITMTGEYAQQGIAALLWFTALLSVNLGLFNLLPIPVLDGGHLLFITIERIRGRKLDPKYQNVAMLVGLFLLVLLMIYATVSDIGRIVK